MPSFNQLLARLSDMFGVGAGAVPFANRNLFVDGALEYAITSSSAHSGNSVGYSCYNVWVANAGTGGASTVSKLQNIFGNSAYSDSNPLCIASYAQTTASTGTFAGRDLPSFAQKVEFVGKLSAKSVTLSAKLWVASGSAVVPGVICTQEFGSGGSPSAGIVLDKAVTWNVTTTPQRFSVRLDMPTVYGKTFGTNNNDLSRFGIYFPAGWTGTMYVSELQLELCNPNASNDINGKGGAPTAFEYRGLGFEFTRIARYYQTLSQATWVAFGSAGAGNYNSQGLVLPVAMRSTPAITPNVGTLSACTGLTLAAQNGSVITSVITGVTSGAGALAQASPIFDARL